MSPLPRASDVLNSDFLPYANRLARLHRFPEIVDLEDGVGSDALENNRCHSPTPVTV
jgi:hypothetical protein